MPTRLRFAVFDLDDTLYPPDNGLWDHLAARINRFMIERLRLTALDAAARRQQYLEAYGTTLNGLLSDFPDLDPAEYLAFVHDLPYERYLKPDPALDRMLHDLPLNKAIFTNADQEHAKRVLTHLGIAGHFGTIVDITSLSFVNKPDPRAYQVLLDCLGARAEECLLIEDSPRNLPPARALGMTTVLVRPAAPDPLPAHYHVARVIEVGPLVAQLIA